MIVWMSRPPNWLLGPRVSERYEERAVKCFLWVVNVRNVCRQRWRKNSFKRFLKERE